PRTHRRGRPGTITSESGETTTGAAVSLEPTHERALLPRLERRGRHLRHGALQLRPGLLWTRRVRGGAPADARMVGVRRVGAGDGVLRRRRAADDGDRRPLRPLR